MELPAELPPLPVTPVGAAASSDASVVVALSVGSVEIGPDWAVTADPEALLPPPSCTLPIELDAVLPPVPPIEAGRLAAASPAGVSADAFADAASWPIWPPSNAPSAALPPPSWTAPAESVELFPPPAIASDAPPLAFVPATEAAAVGDAFVPLTCTAPAESEALLPPPTWTAPTELDELFEPPLPTPTGAPTEAEFPAMVADADGAELTGLVCTAPTEFDDEFPPPACTLPTELEAVLPPVPDTDVGAETDADVAGAEAEADGSTVVDPAWTVPTELSATFWAAAVFAPIRPAHATATVTMSLRSILCLLLRVVLPAEAAPAGCA
jgi:hypothetical protein